MSAAPTGSELAAQLEEERRRPVPRAQRPSRRHDPAAARRQLAEDLAEYAAARRAARRAAP